MAAHISAAHCRERMIQLVTMTLLLLFLFVFGICRCRFSSVASKLCGVWRWYGSRPTGNCLTYSANRVVRIWSVSVSAAVVACEFVHLKLLFSSDLPSLVHFSCFIGFLQKCSLMNWHCLARLNLQTVIDELWTQWSIKRLCSRSFPKDQKEPKVELVFGPKLHHISVIWTGSCSYSPFCVFY